MAPKTSVDSILLKALKKQKVMKLTELYLLVGNRSLVRRKAQQGVIQSLGGGYYASPSLDPLVASAAMVAKYFPYAVISGRTALRIHEFSQDFIEKIDLDISREKNIKNQFLRIHRVPDRRMVGIIEMKYFGMKIKVYDRERALCEAYRIDPEGGYFFKALKRYIASGKVQSELIKKYDEATKTKVLKHLRQELADE